MIKKLLSLAFMVCMSLTAMADDIEAAKLSKITFDGDKVVLHYKDGTTASKEMAEVTIDFSTATGIEERMAITKKAGLEDKAVYNMAGQQVGNSAARLTKGVYLIDGKKVIIK